MHILHPSQRRGGDHRREQRRKRRRARRLRSIAMLPSMATLGNLICGFAAIHFAAMYLAERPPMEVKPEFLTSYLAIAGYLVFLAMFFDAIDGQLARLTRQSSEFGAQLDSLADVVSFGAAPAFMVICLLSHTLQVGPASPGFWGRAAWFMAAAYVACAGLRLARFNVETVPDDKAHNSFRGLPSPAAGFTVVALIVLHEDVLRALAEDSGRWELQLASTALVASLPVVAMLLGLLMVSRIRYTHLVNVYVRGHRPFTHLVGAVFVVTIFLIRPQLTLAALATAYTLSGPFAVLVRRLRGETAQPTPASAPAAHAMGDDETHPAQRTA